MSFFCSLVIMLLKKFYKEMLVSSFKRDNQTVGDFFLLIKEFQEFKSLILFYSESLEFFLVLYKYFQYNNMITVINLRSGSNVVNKLLLYLFKR